MAVPEHGARTIFEKLGLLSLREKHQNGAEWIVWAKDP
jgi:hypothetical protein